MKKTQPKEIFVNLPAVHLFDSEEEIPIIASSINRVICGKVKVKYDSLGVLGGQFVGLFYLQRDHDSISLRDEFLRMIEAEEIANYPAIVPFEEQPKQSSFIWNTEEQCFDPTSDKQ